MHSNNFLLDFTRIYSVERAFIHTLIYWLWKKYGLKLPKEYMECHWRITIHGLFCDRIERDLEELIEKGLIQIDNDGLVYARGFCGLVVTELRDVVAEAIEMHVNSLFANKEKTVILKMSPV